MTRYIKSGTVTTVPQINAELEKIAQAQEEFISRQGKSPNEMKEILDMNDNRLINVGKPITNNDVPRLRDINEIIDTRINVAVGNDGEFDDYGLITAAVGDTLDYGSL